MGILASRQGEEDTVGREMNTHRDVKAESSKPFSGKVQWFRLAGRQTSAQAKGDRRLGNNAGVGFMESQKGPKT